MGFVFIKFMVLPKMRYTQITLALLFCAVIVNFQVSECQLSQDTFNIARGKTITASATCGYDLPPGQADELFCKLATVPGKFGISGLECSQCNPRIITNSVEGTKDHRIEYAIDGTERWWQSPPLSRGLEYNEINITIDLGQVSNYFVFYCSVYVFKRLSICAQCFARTVHMNFTMNFTLNFLYLGCESTPPNVKKSCYVIRMLQQNG